MEVYTIQDIATRLGIRYITVYKAARRLGAGRKIGGVWILDQHDYDSILQSCELAIGKSAVSG